MNNKLRRLDKDKIPYFLCIGSSKSYYDGIASRIGIKLKEKGFDVLNDINNANMQYKLKELNELKEERDKYEFIAIDLSLGNKNIDWNVSNKGIKPGLALGREHRRIGNKSIHINLDYFVNYSKEETLFILCMETNMGNDDLFNKVEDDIVREIINYYK